MPKNASERKKPSSRRKRHHLMKSDNCTVGKCAIVAKAAICSFDDLVLVASAMRSKSILERAYGHGCSWAAHRQIVSAP